jgi:uncharacterized glyoxalase superfamily metalloenzyme YdcJ
VGDRPRAQYTGGQASWNWGARSHLKHKQRTGALTMGYAELIEKLETLADEKRAEVFDFVDYLATRFSSHRAPAVDQWTDREFTDMAMQQAVSGMDDDPVIYGDADLRERCQ